MASDYEAITKDNIRRRGEEFDDIGNLLAEKLYGDRSHFIYELLQNAEDALALRQQEEPGGNFSGDVTFRLCRDHLEVNHYGRLFDEADVRAISDVLRGTKNERLDQIGTFGIGFKSVYAFTRSPEVHSGDEHFVIEHFIRPRAVKPRPLEDEQQTLFYFPFDHPEFDAESAFELIQARLKSLGPRSLLFLHHVKNLLWVVEDAGDGIYMRETRPSDNGGALVEIIGEGTGRDGAEGEWLVIEREVPHPNRPGTLSVKIAYSIRSQREGKSIQPLSRSPLTAYFPTAKETGLGFLIHGPFASTPARDNIQSDSPWNHLLLSELAALTADSLKVCQQQGFLTGDFLATLPIDSEKFPDGSPFRPIYDAVLNALQTESLIPRANGDHATAAQLVLGRSRELRDLLPASLLSDLLGTELTYQGWVDPAVSENRPPKVWQYLRDECGVRVVDGEAFARHITTAFLDARDDAWMARFYSFLNGQEALWRKGSYPREEGPLRTKEFIRCEDDRHRQPFDANQRPQVFLPTDSESDFPAVKRAIYQNEQAKEFFLKLGLVTPDLCTQVLHSILPVYRSGRPTMAEHARHIRVIKAALGLNDSPRYTEMVEALKQCSWVLATKCDNSEARCFRSPRAIHLPTPELQVYLEGNPGAFLLAEAEQGIDWRRLGVRDCPEITCRGLPQHKTHPNDSVALVSERGWHTKGLQCFDPDTNIKGLSHALSTITVQKAAYIWNDLLPPLTPFLHGKYLTATRQTYENARVIESDSTLCKILKQAAWVPVSEDDFRRPSECTVADLHEELKRNDGLVEALGIQPNPAQVARAAIEAQQSLVAQAGFSPEAAALLIENKEVLTADFLSQALSARSALDARQPEFPERPVPNPERRAAKVAERARTADPKRYDKRQRSVRSSRPSVDPSVWLRDQYTNKQDIMVCQLCRKAMPFRRPDDGAYYFEAVQISNDLAKEEHTTYLALCPLCAAKYKVLVKADPDCVAGFIKALLGSQELSVPVQSLNGPMEVRFVETHLHDLRAALPNCLGKTA